MKEFLKRNWFLIFAILYLISPVDLIPDLFLPFLGPLVAVDDVAILGFELIRRIIGYKSKPINNIERKVIEGEIVE